MYWYSEPSSSSSHLNAPPHPLYRNSNPTWPQTNRTGTLNRYPSLDRTQLTLPSSLLPTFTTQGVDHIHKNRKKKKFEWKHKSVAVEHELFARFWRSSRTDCQHCCCFFVKSFTFCVFTIRTCKHSVKIWHEDFDAHIGDSNEKDLYEHARRNVMSPPGCLFSQMCG